MTIRGLMVVPNVTEELLGVRDRHIMLEEGAFERRTAALRLKILEMAHRSGSPHVGSCLSCIDAIFYLYAEVLNFNPDDPEWDGRDYFILSKGHAAMALYVTLAESGIIPEKLLQGYMQDNGTLPAHLDRFSCPGIEVSAGSLGHGLPMAVGIAHGMKLSGRRSRIFALIGDGESQEGSIWEAAMLAPKLRLDNLTVLVDFNNLQGFGRPCELVQFEPLQAKWQAFGWQAVLADGHRLESLRTAFNTALAASHPAVVVLKTIKGKGVSFMEDELKWHYFAVGDEHIRQARAELTHA
jgi:transketolase